MASKIKKHMEWVQVLTIIIATFGMFLWGQRESRSEIRAMRTEIKAEMRDFHGRLCTLEEKYYQLKKRNDIK